jgi:hypothetical protein
LIIVPLRDGALVELVTGILSIFVGMLGGSFLMAGAFRLFSWGESAARSIVVWMAVGGVTLIVLSAVVLDNAANDVLVPDLGSIVHNIVIGIAAGAFIKAVVIRKQLRTEARP